MLKEGQCIHCRLEKLIFLHNVYLENTILQLCTSCLLKMYPGSFCPICFQVYENEDFNSTQTRVICCIMCPAIAHFNCVMSTLASSSTSTTTTTSHYICTSCFDPNFIFFNVHRDEKTKLACIDKRLAQQLLAASIISQRSMKEAAILSKRYAEIRAEEAVRARKEAKKAVEKLAQFTSLANRVENMPSPNLSDRSTQTSSESEENSGDGE